MNLARVSESGQITVPFEIRRALKIKPGDKVRFSQNKMGEVVVGNSSLTALEEAQQAVAGCDYSEEEILADIMQMRYGDKAK